jgi:adenine deaminase
MNFLNVKKSYIINSFFEIITIKDIIKQKGFIMVITANYVDIFNKTVYPAEITIKNGKIQSVKKAEKAENYILPGFIDAHIHVESSMLPPSAFGEIMLTHGHTASVSDPHEIANVLGLKGVEWMIENAELTPFKIYFGASPCVPATPFETSGATLTPEDIEALFKRNDILYLSEVMNFPGVINGDEDMINKLNLAKKYHKHIDGHCPGLRGKDLSKYIKAGIETDHEAFSYDEAEEKISKGMKIIIREGSAAKNFEALHPLIAKYPDKLMFCSDDRHPDDLIKGNINLLVKRSLELGYNLFDVLQIACINPVLHYGLDVGILQNGDPADFIIVDNLTDFNILETYINGNNVYKKGKKPVFKKCKPVNNFNVGTKEKIEFPECGEYSVIEVIEGELITKKAFYRGAVPDTENDILYITVVNRYENKKPATGLIKGFGLKKGAIASSVAHDSHNIVAVGTNKDDLLKAVNTIINLKGGVCCICGEESKSLQLDIAGLMSSLTPYETAKAYQDVQEYARTLGCQLTAPFMTLSFMALLVIPELKISDKGLFDGETFSFTNICN